jgi:sortase (surface protein transpeptidase)
MAPGALASRLVIPGLGSFQTQASLNAGPWQYWHDEDTIAIAGHRTTHSHPFLRLNEVRRGDEIALGKKTFVVRHVRVVRATETWILNWKGLLLSACARSDGSPTSLSYRIVVMAKEM